MNQAFPAVHIRLIVAAIAATYSASSSAQEPHNDEVIQEIIVTSSLQQTRAETALPVHLLSGEALRESAASTLGETLKELVGVNSASFGTGVGSPIIRGQSGNRVQVLQGGVSNIDASAISPDHANNVEAALAERIEVVRGPATLLYGNGAIGGVVNVIDNHIPSAVPDGITGLVESRHNNGSDQQISVIKMEAGLGQIAFHVDSVYRESNDTEIKGFAINPRTVDFDDSEAVEQLLSSDGLIANSNTRADSSTAGLSWVFDGGYLGMSVNRSSNNYGLPIAAHAAHEDDEDHDMEAHEGEEPHGVRIDMEQDRYDFEGRITLGGFVSSLEGKVSVVDYQHAEIEGDGVIGTVINNEGYESRFTFTQQPMGNLQGVTGIQLSSKTFSAIGEEAYIPQTDSQSVALFSVQSLDTGDMIYEFGLRGERLLSDQSGGCDDSTTSVSGSASALWRVREDVNVMVALAHSQRAPSVEERYSNINSATCSPPGDAHDLIAHAGTQRLEIGDPEASKEQSTNIEFGLRRHLGNVTGELNLFYNDIEDYLYLRDTGVFVDDVEIARITQDNALFRGLEAQLTMPVRFLDQQLTELTLFTDYVRAKLDGDGNVPRIPAMRAGAELSHSHANWLYKLRVTRVDSQTRVASNESATPGYTLVNASVDYHAPVLGMEMTLFARAGNLLDEKVRNHVSILKDIAPEAGRNFLLGVRFEF